jgi:hypothetical protein
VDQLTEFGCNKVEDLGFIFKRPAAVKTIGDLFANDFERKKFFRASALCGLYLSEDTFETYVRNIPEMKSMNSKILFNVAILNSFENTFVSGTLKTIHYLK